jgi:hypothetical protein
MNRRILLLSLVLLLLAGSLGLVLRQKWVDAHAHEQQVLNQPPHIRPIAPPPSPPPAAPVSPADYVEVAQKTLFSQDRNPNVVVDPPPPPKPEPPMPALPVYWGQMAFGDPVAILTVGPAGAQKSFHAGEKVGDFKLIAFDSESMTLDWNGKQLEKKLADLAPKEGQQPAAASAAASAPAAAPSQQLTSITTAAPQTSTAPPAVGTDMGGGFRACTGDSAPAGTVVGGYKKVIGQSLMGPTCHWEQTK